MIGRQKYHYPGGLNEFRQFYQLNNLPRKEAPFYLLLVLLFLFFMIQMFYIWNLVAMKVIFNRLRFSVFFLTCIWSTVGRDSCCYEG